MPPLPVPGSREGSSTDGSEEFDFDDAHLGGFLASSLPDHFGLVVGSPVPAFPLPSSLPRLLAHSRVSSYRDFHGDLESGMEKYGSEEEEEHEAALAGLAAAAAPAPCGSGTLPALAAGASAAHAAGGTARPGEKPAVLLVSDGSGSMEESQSEAWRILRLAAPLSISNLAGYAISMVAIAAVGRLGEAALSVVVLATSVFNVTGLSFLIGFSSAMETFCGQAYGAGKYKLVGLVLQRALLLLTLLAAAVAALWTQAEPILLLLGQDPAIAYGTGQFLLRATPALWFTGVFEALKRYLMAQEAVRPATVVTCIALALAPLYNWLLIYRFGLGLYGAAYAMDAMQATLAILLAGYCVARDRLLRGSPVSTWPGLSRKAFTGWWQYCRFALPSVAMLCCEWSTFEVMVLMSGLLPDPTVSVSTMGLCINTSGLAYMLVTGLACATSVRVSNSLGGRLPQAARRATWTAWRLTMCLQLAVGVSIVLGRRRWPLVFTNSPAVVARTADLLPLFALSLFGDGTNAVLQGLLRGAGKQEMGAITNLLSYWCCGIPLAAFLAFKRNMGLEGLWWGLVVINTVQGIIMLTITHLMDFQEQSDKAAAMMEQAAARLEAEAEAEAAAAAEQQQQQQASMSAPAAGAAGAGNPLLAPLLEEAANGAVRAPGAAVGRGGRGRRRDSSGGRHSTDAAGIRERLRQSVLLLLTEGAHARPRHLPARPGRRTRRPAVPAAEPAP